MNNPITTVRSHLNSLAGLGVLRGFTVISLVSMIVWLVVFFNGYFQETTRGREILAVVGGLLGMFFVTCTCLMMNVMGSITNITEALDELLEERERKSRLTALLTDVTCIALTQEGKDAKEVMLATIIYHLTEDCLEQTNVVNYTKVYYDFLWEQEASIRHAVINRCQELIDSAWGELDSYIKGESVRSMNTRNINGFTTEINKLQSVIDLLQSSDDRFVMYSTNKAL